MLHWFHAYGKHNYTRHFFHITGHHNKYLLITSLPYTNSLKKVGFSVRRSYGKFNKVSPDQVIEQTINKDQKGPGGITGFSTSEDTVQRWGLTGHLVAKIRCDMEETLGIRRNKSKPKELQKNRVKHDEEVVS